MNKETLKQILQAEGFSASTIKSYLIGSKGGSRKNCTPTLSKAIKLEKLYGVPCIAWDDIKLFINNDTQ
jgi:hypothetical protein